MGHQVEATVVAHETGFACPWCTHWSTHSAFVRQHWDKELVGVCHACDQKYFIFKGKAWRNFSPFALPTRHPQSSL